MAIETGIAYDRSNNFVHDPSIRMQRPTASGTILFDNMSLVDQPYSDIITVEPGEAVLIDAYNIPIGTKLITHKVVIAAYDPITLDAVCTRNKPGLIRPFTILQTKPMTIGPDGADGWILDENKLDLLITLPGTYQLECTANPVPTDLLFVSYKKWPLLSTPGGYPSEYLGGFK